MNDTVSLDIWKDVFKNMAINLFCVAAHYSNRYGNSDSFLLNYGSEDLRNYAFYMKNNDQAAIIQQFCDYAIEPSASITMNWKSIHYLWKLFISNQSYPSMIYANSLKSLLRDKFTYQEETDSFVNITSKYLPLTRDFIAFWENTMIILEDGNPTQALVIEIDEMEIEEVCSLFKKWTQENGTLCVTHGNINEQEVIKLISHFYPQVEIIDNKYLLNIRSQMWNKVADIQQSLQDFKKKHSEEKDGTLSLSEELGEGMSLVSLDQIYQFYCTFCNKHKTKIASKRYFEKFVVSFLASHILFEKFISNDWFQ